MTTPANPDKAHPGNDYYVNPVTGTIQKQSNPVLAFGLLAAGYQGPMDFGEAEAVLGILQGTGADTPVNAPRNAAKAASNPTSWLQGLGGQIGSGIEAAFVYFLKDLWSVIIGPVEIIAGVALAILILVFMFKDDLASAAALIP